MRDMRYVLTEEKYDMAKERHHATLFATGNGYMGVRGSFEEYSTLGVQGLYVRGILDEITEICTPVPDDYYMKKYYFNEERLKDFEKTECGVNLADILTVRIVIGGELFQMHEGTVLSYRRELDFRTGTLVRRVRWKNASGDITDLRFERFASYADEHFYCQKVTVTPVNHGKHIEISSGIDLRTKTNGQRVTKILSQSVRGQSIRAEIESGSRYAFACAFAVENTLTGNYTAEKADEQGILCVKYSGSGKCVLEKITCIVTSRDTCQPLGAWIERRLRETPGTYDAKYKAHLSAYRPAFERGNAEIEGDDEMARAAAFSCWQTLISACKADSVHGVGAKGLTGEQYHQYVWWDSEIYQMPYFIYTAPQIARHLLEYRYKTLAQARKNAENAGFRGARYAFCSGVTGEECVWSFCNHPFMQDHISADVAFSVLNYDAATGDRDFMEKYGYEILFACLEYWLSRVVKTERGFEILRVTGTDEHHPFVNNDAYTNYMVRYIADRGCRILRERAGSFDFGKIGAGGDLARKLEKLSNEIYLPVDENGMIPQFDGYFGLLRDSETTKYVQGSQMKHKGYHQSQFIKQPDVVMLYTYNNVGMDEKYYARNFDYYEKMCECSSSLSYAPHAIASIDNDRLLSFYEYLKKTAEIDLKNLHGGSEDGIHSGCAAGVWYSVFRGIFGCVCGEDGIRLCPKRLPWWKSVRLRFFYKSGLIKMEICGNIISISKLSGPPAQISIYGKEYLLKKGKLQVEIR